MLPPAKVRLFVRLIVRSWPVGTVITTGDHRLPTEATGVAGLVLNVCTAGLSAVHVAVEPVTAGAPGVAPHGTAGAPRRGGRAPRPGGVVRLLGERPAPGRHGRQDGGA